MVNELETISLSVTNKEYLDKLLYTYKFKSMNDLLNLLLLHIKESIANKNLIIYNQ